MKLNINFSARVILALAVADEYNEVWANNIIAKLDKNNGASAMFTAVKSMLPLKSLSGVYTVVGDNDWFYIVFPMETGTMIAVSPDLKEYQSIEMKYSDVENTETHGVGYGWVRNSIAIDKDGGIYALSRNHMHKIVWTGDRLSTDEADGAWTAEYRNGHIEGSGATPSLMGFGDEDRFVVFTDGDIRMNVVLMWRDEIPENFDVARRYS